MSLLRELSQFPESVVRLEVRYDEVRQISEVRDVDEWRDSWSSSLQNGTKKFTTETGEDSAA